MSDYLSELRVRNWDKWQSYRKDRGQPPWIKVYRALMRDPNWVELNDAQRGQLVSIWMLAADRDGAIPTSAALIRKLCFMDSEPDIKLLIEKGFLVGSQGDANVTAERRQDDQPETEAETDKKIVQIEDLNKSKANRNSRKEQSGDPHFIEFYRTYPRHQSKQDAIRAYNQVRRSGVPHEIIMQGLERAKRQDSRFREAKFTPLPASWLRDGGYEDEPSAKTNDWKMAVFS